MNSWLDTLPISERQKIREKYKLSAAAYEKLREKVKGPEDIQEEMHWNEKLAELRFGVETEPQMKEALKKQIEKDITEQGIEAVLELSDEPLEVTSPLESGSFDVSIDSNQIALAPEGNVEEKIPIRKAMMESYLSQLYY